MSIQEGVFQRITGISFPGRVGIVSDLDSQPVTAFTYWDVELDVMAFFPAPWQRTQFTIGHGVHAGILDIIQWPDKMRSVDFSGAPELFQVEHLPDNSPNYYLRGMHIMRWYNTNPGGPNAGVLEIVQPQSEFPGWILNETVRAQAPA